MVLGSLARRSVTAFALAFTALCAQAQRSYDIGVGSGDMTAVALDASSDAWVVTDNFEGLQSRLRARAFLIADRPQAREIAFVVAEMGEGSALLKQLVLQVLAERWPGRFARENLVLVATHTHGAPPVGDAEHPKLLKAHVHGIVDAVAQAVADQATGQITVSRGRLEGIARNRSEQAFDLNDAQDKALFPLKTDPAMTQLGFWRNGAPVGALTFFGVHPTTMVDEGFTQLTGDSYGHAAQRLEDAMRDKGAAHFVAAFAQTTPGDQTSNIHFDRCQDVQQSSHHQWGCRRGLSDLGPAESMRTVGERLYGRARELLMAPPHPVDDGLPPAAQGLNHRYAEVDLSQRPVDARYTGGSAQTTCAPAWGAAFTAGSQEDLGTPLATEGANNRGSIASVIGWLLQVPVLADITRAAMRLAGLGDVRSLPIDDALRACHGRKQVILALAPRPSSFHLLKLGALHLAIVPHELSVMAGYRIRRQLAATLGLRVDEVLALGYASGSVPGLGDDGAGGYVVTPEEYESQQYEAGYMTWGPWSQPAITQELDRLAVTLTDNAAPALTPVPSDDPLLRAIALPEDALPAAVPWDGVPWSQAMGAVLAPPQPRYPPSPADASDRRRFASAEFVSAHPMNRLRRNDTFALVERQRADGRWEEAARDGRWGLVIRWQSTGGLLCLQCRSATVRWQIPDDAAPGRYRIVHLGDHKPSWLGAEVRSFRAESPSFVVEAQRP